MANIIEQSKPATPSMLHRRFDDNANAYYAQYQATNRYITNIRRFVDTLRWVPDDGYAFQNEFDAMRKITRDAVCAYAMRFRRLLIAGRSWHLLAKSPEYEQYIPVLTELLSRCDTFTQDRFVLSRAIFTGMEMQRMVGERQHDIMPGTNAPRDWHFITTFLPIDKRRIRLEWDTLGGVAGKSFGGRRWYWTMYDYERRAWYEIPNESWYLMLRYGNDEETVGYGHGRLDEIYYYYYVKTHMLKYASQFAERFADPWIIAKLESLKGYTDEHSAHIQQYLNVIQKMRGNRVLVHDSADEIQLAEAGGSAKSFIMDFIKYLDEGIIRACLGGTDNTSGGGGGSKARAEVHENSMELNANFDRQVMEEAYSQRVLRGLWRWNYRNLQEMNGGAYLPKLCPLTFKLNAAMSYDPEARLNILKGAIDMGVKIEPGYVADELDIRVAEAGAETLQPESEAEAPAPAGLGFNAEEQLNGVLRNTKGLYL